MKKIFVAVLYSILVVFLGFVFYVYLSDNQYDINRKIVINAPKDSILNQVYDLKKFTTWEPWRKLEPSAKYDFSPISDQENSFYTWQGKELGKGKLMNFKIYPDSIIQILNFYEPMESKSECYWHAKQLPPTKTELTWGMRGTNETFLAKFYGVFIDSMMDEDFKSGLQNLKQKVER